MATVVRIEFANGTMSQYEFRGRLAYWYEDSEVYKGMVRRVEKSTSRCHAVGYISIVLQKRTNAWVRCTVFRNGKVRVLRAS